MSSIRDAWRRAGRLLPKSLLWRFFLAAIALGALTAVTAMLTSYAAGRDLLFRFQEEAGLSVLRGAAELTGSAWREIVHAREDLVSARRAALGEACSRAAGMLSALTFEQSGAGDPLEKARAMLAAMPVDGVELLLLDADGAVAAHSGPNLLIGLSSGKPSPNLAAGLSELAAAARNAPGAMAYTTLSGDGGGSAPLEPLLLGAMSAGSSGLVACAATSLQGMDQELARKRQAVIAALRDRLGGMPVAKTGYVYVFDEDCRMLVHPTLAPDEFRNLTIPGEDAHMCGELKRISRQPWGANRLFYNWDRPEDKGVFVYPKISWCVREPASGWYVGASVYAEEMRISLPRMIAIVFFPALMSIVIMGSGLTLLLQALLRPVRALSLACREIGRGDLRARAPEDAPGELGFLGRQFNAMVDSLTRLRRKDKRRQEELEALNSSLERMVAKRTQALERKAAKLAKANARLTELDALKSSFLSSISHELRTPLTSIKGFAKLIAKDLQKVASEGPEPPASSSGKRERALDNLGIIVDESDRLTRLINDVLDLSKIESGRVEWKDEPFNIREAILDAAASLSEELAKKPDVTLSLDLPVDLPQVRADRGRLTQVMLNLLDNALKFTRKGSVTTCARSRDGWLTVETRDTGMGIRREDLLGVFDRFQQAGAGPGLLLEKPKGTGLGLSICQNILTRHGGLIWAESELGKGTSIVFEMPLDFARPETEAEEEQAREALYADENAPLILAVDPDPAVRAGLRRWLENGGYRALTAPGHRQAQDIAAHNPVDGLIMDLGTPLPDGRTPFSAIDHDPILSALPALSLRPGDASGAFAARDGDTAGGQPLLDALDALFREKIPARACLAVSGDGDPSPQRMLFASPDNCLFHVPEALPDILEAGFEGLVFIPAHLAGRMDVAALAARPGVQIVITPV